MYRLLELNPQLKPFAGDIDLRMSLYHQTKSRLLSGKQTLNEFANAHEYYGFHRVDGGWYYREWAPGAEKLYLTGDFCGWDNGCSMTRSSDGIFEASIDVSSVSIGDKYKYKILIVTKT